MPKPNKGETKEQFVQRCIPIVLEDGTAEDNKQAVAVCNSIWEQSKNLAQFSFTIKKASLDPKTGEMRWRADTSDTEIDGYGDRMSLELYSDFLDRIEKNETAPEEHTSEFWAGGMPYLSISHYDDLNGDGVPGDVENLFVDGKFLKAKGTFFDTSLGKKCWEAVKSDFKSDADNKVRISIAFLDYQHKHLSTGYVFERSEGNTICAECLKEFITDDYGGKEYQRGHLIHLALTRVPVNERTLMEVDRSMTTQKEDAESIVGEELAEELDEKAKTEVTKSLVIKSEADEDVEEEIVQDNSAAFSLHDERLDKIENAVLQILSRLDEAKEEVEPEPEEVVEEEIEEKSEVVQLAEVIAKGLTDGFAAMNASIGEKLDILIAANSNRQEPGNDVYQRRSIDPSVVQQQLVTPSTNPTTPKSIKDFARRSVMGQ